MGFTDHVIRRRIASGVVGESLSAMRETLMAPLRDEVTGTSVRRGGNEASRRRAQSFVTQLRQTKYLGC